MKKYNKLVRDRIPEIIIENGEKPSIRKLKQKEFKTEILKKLVEEVKEVQGAKDRTEMIKELADVQEIMNALYGAYKIERSDVTQLARRRRKERGAFKNKIFLKSVK